MELKELSVSVGTTTTTILKPTTVIASTISREYLNILEQREYCKITESNLKEYESKIHVLISSKNESAKIRADYKIRNKINHNNSESLFQAKNELYKYKCELKSNYIAAEKSLKLKKLKYKKIISSYESDWQKALEEFNANPVVIELLAVEEENARLETEIKKQEELNSSTEKKFFELKEYIRRTILKKTIEFSKIMIKYREFCNLQKRNKEISLLEQQKNSPSNFEFFFFKTPSFTEKNSPGLENNDDMSCLSSIDVSIFDDLMVPTESLESQNLDEDILSTSLNKEQSSIVSKDQEDDFESLKQCQKKGLQQSKKAVNDASENSGMGREKAIAADENESQYFRMQPTECSVNLKNGESNPEKSNPAGGASEVPEQNLQNEEIYRKRHMENEEFLSDGSSENQFGNQREIYECQYRKTSSVSSDEFLLPIENMNEEPESPQKPQEEKRKNHLFNPCESEKPQSKSLAGFFTNDSNSPKPSIFKLF